MSLVKSIYLKLLSWQLTQSILSFGGHLEGILSAIVAKRDMVLIVGRSCHEDLQKRGSR